MFLLVFALVTVTCALDCPAVQPASALASARVGVTVNVTLTLGTVTPIHGPLIDQVHRVANNGWSWLAAELDQESSRVGSTVVLVGADGRWSRARLDDETGRALEDREVSLGHPTWLARTVNAGVNGTTNVRIPGPIAKDDAAVLRSVRVLARHAGTALLRLGERTPSLVRTMSLSCTSDCETSTPSQDVVASWRNVTQVWPHPTNAGIVAALTSGHDCIVATCVPSQTPGTALHSHNRLVIFRSGGTVPSIVDEYVDASTVFWDGRDVLYWLSRSDKRGAWTPSPTDDACAIGCIARSLHVGRFVLLPSIVPESQHGIHIPQAREAWWLPVERTDGSSRLASQDHPGAVVVLDASGVLYTTVDQGRQWVRRQLPHPASVRPSLQIAVLSARNNSFLVAATPVGSSSATLHYSNSPRESSTNASFGDALLTNIPAHSTTLRRRSLSSVDVRAGHGTVGSIVGNGAHRTECVRSLASSTGGTTFEPVASSDTGSAPIRVLGDATVSARLLDRDALYTVESSAGIWLANGYDVLDGGADDCGAPDPSHPSMATYVSRDAGLHFSPLLNRSSHFDLSAAGFMLVAPTDTQRAADASFYISLDDGQTLHQCALAGALEPLVQQEGGVEDVVIESVRALSIGGPLMVVGTLRIATGDARWFVATVAPTVPTCDTSTDYVEVLIPEDECILGRQLALDRRRAGSQCVHAPSAGLSVAVTRSCPCTASDYECDECFSTFISSSEDSRRCLPTMTGTCQDLLSPARTCSEPGAIGYVASRGYRLVDGTGCDLATGLDLSPTLEACPKVNCPYLACDECANSPACRWCSSDTYFGAIDFTGGSCMYSRVCPGGASEATDAAQCVKPEMCDPDLVARCDLACGEEGWATCDCASAESGRGLYVVCNAGNSFNVSYECGPDGCPGDGSGLSMAAIIVIASSVGCACLLFYGCVCYRRVLRSRMVKGYKVLRPQPVRVGSKERLIDEEDATTRAPAPQDTADYSSSGTDSDSSTGGTRRRQSHQRTSRRARRAGRRQRQAPFGSPAPTELRELDTKT